MQPWVYYATAITCGEGWTAMELVAKLLELADRFERLAMRERDPSFKDEYERRAIQLRRTAKETETTLKVKEQIAGDYEKLADRADVRMDGG
jgi:hypothetical protein